MKSLLEDDEIKGAVFGGANNEYRYTLDRIWKPSVMRVMFCMLNPSTADADNNDPTIRRCINFARTWGFGGLHVGNIFALRSTNPENIYKAADPVGPGNMSHLATLRAKCSMVICAWGAHGKFQGQGERVWNMFNSMGNVYCLQINADGTPKHLLYVASSRKPILYTGGKN